MSRLIDADAFKEYLKNAFEEVKHMYPDGGEFARQITEDFCRDIDEQPTINAEPERKKGKWIYATNAPSGESCYVCSECGVKLDSRYTSYCGNCGSKMERW